MARVESQWEELMTRSIMSSDLPNEIVIEILIKLPVKSIMRFKCACKPWKNVFGDPKFIEMHLNHSLAEEKECLLLRRLMDEDDEDENNFFQKDEDLGRQVFALQLPSYGRMPLRLSVHEAGNGFLLNGKVKDGQEIYSLRKKHTFEEIKRLEGLIPSKTSYYAIIDSSNGLICLTESDMEGWRLTLNLFLWNPATREFITLPKFYVNRFTGPVRVIALGFAFHPAINDYRVVRIVFFVDIQAVEVEVYSLKTDSWTTIEADMDCYFNDQLSQAYLNSALHWTVFNKDDMGERQFFILSYDVVNDKFGELQLPPFDFEDYEFLLQKHTSNSGEFLALFIHDTFENCDIWVMKEYGMKESWTKLFSIGKEAEIMTPFGLFDDGQALMEKREDRELVSCKPNDESINNLQVFTPARIVKYIESLVPLTGPNRSSTSHDWYSSACKACTYGGSGYSFQQYYKWLDPDYDY